MKKFYTYGLVAFWAMIGVNSVIGQEQQNVHLPLSVVLQSWNTETGLQFSGKAELLKQCYLPDIKLKEASLEHIAGLVDHCELTVKKVGEVFVILEQTELNLYDGFVRDSLTGKPIPNATVTFDDEGTTTDIDGYFLIVSDKHKLDVSISHVSYGQKEQKLCSSLEANILLKPQSILMSEVKINSKRKRYISSLSSDDQLLRTERKIAARFYRSFEDLLSDSSFQTAEVPIKPIFLKHGIIYHRVRLPIQKRKEIGNVYGFSDGKFVYINHRSPSPKRKTDFYRIEKLGPYFYFKEIWRLPPHKLVSWLAERLVDTKTGQVITLTRGVLRELIADDEELLELFNAEKGKSDKLKLYLIEYFKRKEAKNSK